MKGMGFVGLFSIIAVAAFGQQFPWLIVRDGDTRHVPLNIVTREILVFCDQYDRYYDFTGFSKEKFIRGEGLISHGSAARLLIRSEGFHTPEDTQELAPGFFIEKYGFGDRLNDIEDLTFFALRSNFGHGSVILVMCTSKNNANTIIFTSYMEPELGVNYSLTYDKNKFVNLIKALFS
ncbi:MAG: hypothetical protein LBH57_08825 [Treponema sp.]|jgi:hypothetical protein|nr:hypothetical protein [Treponema sp.]